MNPLQIEIDYTSRFWGRVDQSGGPDTCWPWMQACNPDGYGQFWINGRTRMAHNIAYEFFTNTKIICEIIRHSCDNPPCCNPAHLLPGTHQDNMADKVARNRQAMGEINGNSKLTADQVVSIRHRHKRNDKVNGTTHLAKEFCVTRKVIIDIVHNRIWRHL